MQEPNFLYLTATQWIAITTVVLAIIATIQACIYGAMHNANKVAERAYVAMSHHPPGIRVHSERLPSDGGEERWRHNVTLRVKVTNHGNTPARVTRSLVQVLLTNDEFPQLPNYAEELARRGQVSLVKDGNYTITTPYEFKSTGGASFSAAFAELFTEGHRLYVIGYVDYIDKFDQRHRSGYGRIYQPSIDDRRSPEYQIQATVDDGDVFIGNMQSRATRFDPMLYDARNNLAFLTQPGYNYDRKRKRGEGSDWDQPQK
jgi:hypothetical protein